MNVLLLVIYDYNIIQFITRTYSKNNILILSPNRFQSALLWRDHHYGVCYFNEAWGSWTEYCVRWVSDDTTLLTVGNEVENALQVSRLISHLLAYMYPYNISRYWYTHLPPSFPAHTPPTKRENAYTYIWYYMIRSYFVWTVHPSVRQSEIIYYGLVLGEERKTK